MLAVDVTVVGYCSTKTAEKYGTNWYFMGQILGRKIKIKQEYKIASHLRYAARW